MQECRHRLLRVCRNAATTNFLPMIVLWVGSVVVVFSYYAIPSVPSALEPLAHWQNEGGWIAAFLSRVVFCGVLPGIFIVCIKSLRPKYVLGVIAVQTVWSGICGIVSDRMFSFNAHLFGSGISFPVLCAKTAVCQFIWTPLIFAPLGSIVYFWMGRDFSFVRFRREMPKRFYSGLVLPNLLANWILWIPVTFAVHMFPTPLQIQLSGMASALFSLMLLAMGREK